MPLKLESVDIVNAKKTKNYTSLEYWEGWNEIGETYKHLEPECKIDDKTMKKIG